MNNDRDLYQHRSQNNPTLPKKGKIRYFEEKEDISDDIPPAQFKIGTSSNELRASRTPLKDISLEPYINHDYRDHNHSNAFGNARNETRRHMSRNVSDEFPVMTDLKRETSANMPLVPYRTHRQETHDEDDMYELERKHRPEKKYYDDNGSERNKKPTKKYNRSRSNDSDSDDSSTHGSKSSYMSQDRKDSNPTLYALLQVLECEPNYLEALAQLKLMLKRSDLTEVLPPRHASDKGRCCAVTFYTLYRICLFLV